MAISARTSPLRSAWVLATISSLLPASTVLAETPSRSESKVIQFRDPDLSTDEGARALYERIKTAAWRVCSRETSSHRGIDQRARLFHCYEDAVANAVQRVNQARLVALHRQHSRPAAD